MSGHDCQNPQKRIKLNDGDDIVEEEVDCFADADNIAQLCYKEYSKLGKSGKPTDKQAEHTVLACIIECELQQRCPPQVVALATGTKCFPGNIDYRRQEIVDCHAESLLKRAFKCYLLQLVDDCLTKGGDQQLLGQILSRRRYCLFVSQTPCGVESRWKGDEGVDQKEKETSFRHFKSVGVNRKPGRGELCPKTACIHKLAKWTIFGLQGRLLLPLFGRPITVQKIILGNCELNELNEVEFPCEKILARMTIDPDEFNSLTDQLYHPLPSSVRPPKLAFASKFRYEEFLREDGGNSGKKKRPCGSSIAAWQLKTLNLNGPEASTSPPPLHCEVLAAGRKLGASRKQQKAKPKFRGQQPGKELLTAAEEKPRSTDTGCGEVIDGTAGAEVVTTTESAAAAAAAPEAKKIVNKQQPAISGHHRPADLAVSDSGLYQRVAGLLPQFLQGCARDEAGDMNTATTVVVVEDDDSIEKRRKRGAAADGDGAKCRLETESVQSRSGALDGDQLMAAYEHNWRLMQQCISIFRGWPSQPLSAN